MAYHWKWRRYLRAACCGSATSSNGRWLAELYRPAFWSPLGRWAPRQAMRSRRAIPRLKRRAEKVVNISGARPAITCSQPAPITAW